MEALDAQARWRPEEQADDDAMDAVLVLLNAHHEPVPAGPFALTGRSLAVFRVVKQESEQPVGLLLFEEVSGGRLTGMSRHAR